MLECDVNILHLKNILKWKIKRKKWKICDEKWENWSRSIIFSSVSFQKRVDEISVQNLRLNMAPCSICFLDEKKIFFSICILN